MKNYLKPPGYILLFLQVLAILLGACTAPIAPSGVEMAGKDERGGYMSLFLNLREDQSPPVQMELQSIEVFTDSGSWQPLILDTEAVDARTIGAGQIFLGRGRLQQGYYSRIRLILQGSSLVEKEGPVALKMEHAAVDLPVSPALYFQDGDSHSLFLTWDVRNSLLGGRSFIPVLQIAPRLRNLIADAAYVSCPDINTVFMIRTDKNWVYDSLGVGDRPVYLFSSPVAPDENLFALTADKPGIKRIGPSVNRVVQNYSLPVTGEATHMALSPDGRLAYIVDRQRGSVMRMNLTTGTIEKRVRIDYGPSYIIYLPQRNILAVSLSLSQNVALLDPESLTTVGVINTGSRPEGLLLSGSLLYIAETGGNSVLVYDLERGTVWKRIPVDYSPKRILAADGFIYVSNYDSRTISLLRPGQLGVSRSITISGPPLEMADVPDNRWIYVGNEGNNTISIIDPLTSRIVGHIPLGARPGGIAVIDR